MSRGVRVVTASGVVVRFPPMKSDALGSGPSMFMTLNKAATGTPVALVLAFHDAARLHSSVVV